ncbi:MAG: stage III sporulation protein AA [Bacillota bacterium]
MTATTARLKEMLRFFTPALRGVLEALPVWDEVEEIRLRAAKPLMIRLAQRDAFVTPGGLPVDRAEESFLVPPEEVTRTVNIASGASLYAFEEEIRNGYITLPGGHRLGLAGQVVTVGGQIRTLKHISGLNFRLAREVRGAADGILPRILAGSPPRVCHTLIISPPRAGKTTFLRDLVRQLSDGSPCLRGVTIGLVDERSEVASCFHGVPQLDVGARTDVLDACPKAEGMRLMIRAFGPEVVATDEIGRAEDARAVEDALNAGMSVVATAHAGTLEELKRRPFFRYIFTLGVIERFILLARRDKPGRVTAVLDGSGKPLWPLTPGSRQDCRKN